mgnify:CR=1 FL=1
MGIQNKDGALYFATGIDNSGLYSGRQEAMGIINSMYSVGSALVQVSHLPELPKVHTTLRNSFNKA